MAAGPDELLERPRLRDSGVLEPDESELLPGEVSWPVDVCLVFFCAGADFFAGAGFDLGFDFNMSSLMTTNKEARFP